MESAFIGAKRRRPGYLPFTTDVRFYLFCVHGLSRSIILPQGVLDVRHRRVWRSSTISGMAI